MPSNYSAGLTKTIRSPWGQIRLLVSILTRRKKRKRIPLRGRDPEGEEREEGEIFTTKISFYIKQGRDLLPASSCDTTGNDGV